MLSAYECRECREHVEKGEVHADLAETKGSVNVVNVARKYFGSRARGMPNLGTKPCSPQEHLSIYPHKFVFTGKEKTMQYLPTLRVFFGAGRYNDYRLRGETVEFLPNVGGKWRALDDSDLQLHLRFNTPVAKWLREHSTRKARPPGAAHARKSRRVASASAPAHKSIISEQ